MENNCGIYLIENTINSKKYIGSSIELLTRIKRHKYSLKKNVHKNSHLQAAYNSYGDSIFKYLILEYCDKLNLIENEKKWIYLLDTKNREKGYNYLEPGENNVGYKHSQESIKLKNLKLQKKVNQYDLKGNFIKQYNSIKEAATIIGINSSGITNCCKRKFRQKTAGNFVWRYKGDNDISFDKKVYKKEVFQYTICGKLINKYSSIHEASRNTGLRIMGISDCINNKRKTIKGFLFKTSYNGSESVL